MTQPVVNSPPTQRDLNVIDKPGGGQIAEWPPTWLNWFTQAFNVLAACSSYGTTAQRPTTNLWPGRPYFDTSLGTYGKPIWVGKDGATWILADGTTA